MRAEPLSVDDMRELAIAIPQMPSLTMIEFKGAIDLILEILFYPTPYAPPTSYAPPTYRLQH